MLIPFFFLSLSLSDLNVLRSLSRKVAFISLIETALQFNNLMFLSDVDKCSASAAHIPMLLVCSYADLLRHAERNEEQLLAVMLIDPSLSSSSR